MRPLELMNCVELVLSMSYSKEKYQDHKWSNCRVQPKHAMLLIPGGLFLECDWLELEEVKLSEFLVDEESFANGRGGLRRRKKNCFIVWVVPRVLH